MEFYTLASGSSGNCSLVREGETAVLIDAGISARRIARALEGLGVRLGDLSAVLITHEHADHVSGLATLVKQCRAPVFASRGTAQMLARALGAAADRLLAFDAGETLPLGALSVRTFSTSHDAADPVGYRFDAAEGALGILTDTGYITREASEALLGVDTLLLEANHDIETLQSGPYPYFLKQRILSEHGHLSNLAAAEFAEQAVRAGARDVILAHLSRENNTPAIAEYTVGRTLQRAGLTVRLSVAPRETVSEVHPCKRSRSCASEN